jgi:uncharacterized protein YbaP (TraB family)
MRIGILALVTALVLHAPPAFAEPALWKIADGNNTVWLFGSVHILDRETVWRTPALEEALRTSTHVYYEVSLSDQTVLSALAEHGFNPPGTTLMSYLSKEQNRILKRVCRRLDLPLEKLAPLRPWLASVTLSGVAVIKAGFDPASGVEARLQAETPDDAERYFESAGEQMGFFAGLSDAEQVGLLVSSLEPLAGEAAGDYFRALVDGWRRGDLEFLETSLIDAMQDYRETYEALIVGRNRAWARKIEMLIQGAENVMIVVGAGHLVGEDSVIRLLQAQGFAVERVQ